MSFANGCWKAGSRPKAQKGESAGGVSKHRLDIAHRAKNELLNAAYHDLLRSIILDNPAVGVSTTQSHQFLTAFLLAIRTSPELATEQLLLSGSRLFNTLFGHKSASATLKQGNSSTNGILVKAENWLETLGGLIAVCSHMVDLRQTASDTGKSSVLQLDPEHSQGLLQLARLIAVETNASLVISQTRRKVSVHLAIVNNVLIALPRRSP